MITRGSADDLPAVMTVMTAAFEPRYGEAWTSAQCLALLALPGAHLWLARQPEVIGFALARTIVGECELMMIGVLPVMQRRGIGRVLLSRIIEEAGHQNAEAIFLEVRRGNPAIALYASSKFKQVGLRSLYYRGASGEQFDAETHRLSLI